MTGCWESVCTVRTHEECHCNGLKRQGMKLVEKICYLKRVLCAMISAGMSNAQQQTCGTLLKHWKVYKVHGSTPLQSCRSPALIHMSGESSTIHQEFRYALLRLLKVASARSIIACFAYPRELYDTDCLVQSKLYAPALHRPPRLYGGSASDVTCHALHHRTDHSLVPGFPPLLIARRTEE